MARVSLPARGGVRRTSWPPSSATCAPNPRIEGAIVREALGGHEWERFTIVFGTKSPMTSRIGGRLIMGGIAIAGAVLGLRVLPWAVRHVADAHAVLRERATLLARTREEMASLPRLRDSAGVLSQALVALAPQVLSGSTSAEAGADLSARMNLAASRAPAKVERLDPLPDSSGVGRLGRVRVHAALETDVRGFDRVDPRHRRR